MRWGHERRGEKRGHERRGAAPPAPASYSRSPQPASSLLLITFAIARSTSTVATRSPSQSHCIMVVGTAHTCRGTRRRVR